MHNNDVLEAWLLTVPIAVHVRTSIEYASWDWCFDVLDAAPVRCELELFMERGGRVARGRDESLHSNGSMRLLSAHTVSESDFSKRRWRFRCVSPWHLASSDCLRGRLDRQAFVLVYQSTASVMRRVVLEIDLPTAERVETVVARQHRNVIVDALVQLPTVLSRLVADFHCAA